MCCRKIEMDDTRQQRFGYPEGSLPVPRICNALNDFSNGTVECHWHPEFQFGLVLKGELEYLLYRNPTSKIQRSLKSGDVFLSTPVCCTVTASCKTEPKFLFFPFPRAFSPLLLCLEIFIRKLCCQFYTPRSSAFSLTIISNNIRRSWNSFTDFINLTQRARTMNFTGLN